MFTIYTLKLDCNWTDAIFPVHFVKRVEFFLGPIYNWFETTDASYAL